MIIKKCPICGNKFETWKTNKKYCSKKCYERAKYMRKVEKQSQKTKLIKKCSYCGDEFKTTKKNQKYCSYKCYKKAKQDKSNYKTKNKRLPVGTINVKSTIIDDFELEQKRINHLKKRAGLS